MPPSTTQGVSLIDALNRLDDPALPDVDTLFLGNGNDILDHLIGIQQMVRNRRLFGCPLLPVNAWKGDAIAVGSGPSLMAQLDTLRSCQDHMLIVAAHSAIPKLLEHGIVPHMIAPKERDPDMGIIPHKLPDKVIYAGLPCVPVAPDRCKTAYLVGNCDPLMHWLGFGRQDISSPSNSGSLAAWVAATVATGYVYLVGYDMTMGHYDGFRFPEENPNGTIMCADGVERPSCPVYRMAQNELSAIAGDKVVIQTNPKGGVVRGRFGRQDSLKRSDPAGFMVASLKASPADQFTSQIRRLPDIFETAEYRCNIARNIADLNVDTIFGEDRHLGGSMFRTAYISASILRRTLKLSDDDARDMLRESLLNVFRVLKPVARNLVSELS